MEVLATSQRIFSWFCICPLPRNANYVRFTQIFFTAFLVLVKILALVASAAFLYENVKINMLNSLNGLLQLSVLGTVTFSLLITLIFRRKFDDIFVSLQEIYDSKFSYVKKM